MASMFFLVWIIIILTFFAVIIGSTKVKAPSFRRRTVSSDGHVVPRNQDLTCDTVYGHTHGSEDARRYIVHEDPPEGYVILNGIKRSLEECKYL